MPARLLLASLLAILALTGTAATADAAKVVKRDSLGFGTQQPSAFADPAFKWLGFRKAKLVIPWNALRIPHERDRVRWWMAEADRLNVEPLIAFGRSWDARGARHRPSFKRYLREFKRFRRMFPEAKTFIPWNEPNHSKQPIWRKPRIAAGYYNVLRKACKKCTIVAGVVVDTDGFWAWIRRYKKGLKYRPKVWGIHNYRDTYERRDIRTRRMLRLTSGQLWLVETGGIVRRPGGRTGVSTKQRVYDAAKATDYVLRLAKAHKRITRIYLYQWQELPTDQWDSALVDAKGKFRPALRVAARFLRRNLRTAPRSIKLRSRGSALKYWKPKAKAKAKAKRRASIKRRR